MNVSNILFWKPSRLHEMCLLMWQIYIVLYVHGACVCDVWEWCKAYRHQYLANCTIEPFNPSFITRTKTGCSLIRSVDFIQFLSLIGFVRHNPIKRQTACAYNFCYDILWPFITTLFHSRFTSFHTHSSFYSFLYSYVCILIWIR